MMKKLSTIEIKNRTTELKELNEEAKNLVKTGKFRALSEKLVEIIDKPELAEFFKKDFSLNDNNLEKSDRLNLECEILRYRLFVFQHLIYFDALTQEKDIDLIKVRISEEEAPPLQELFDNLKTLRNRKIISLEDVEKEAKSVYEELSKNAEPRSSWEVKDKIEKKLWQEKVWLILCYINESLFHSDKFDDSLTRLERVRDFIFEKVADNENSPKAEPFFCFTTKATILSLIANSQAMKGQLRESEINYYEAIRLYTAKAKNPKDKEGEAPHTRDQNNIKFQFRRTAQIFIYGLLKVNAKKSNIDRCKANLLITELLLTKQKEVEPILLAGDVTTLLALEFSKLVIQRIEAGVDAALLREIKENLLRIKEYLEILSHRPLLAEVNFELAILNHLLRNWETSELLLTEVEDYYGESLYRMRANSYILRSHIKRAEGNFPKSIEYAQKSVNFAKMSNNIIAKMDAAICLAESCFEYNKLGNETTDDAYKLFERALTLNEQTQSHKIDAICFLGLCKVSAFRKDREKAEDFYNKYLTIKQFCQHKFVLDNLEIKSKTELDALKSEDLFIINSKDDLNYEKNLESLKIWLFSKAEENSLTDTDIAKKLNISRQSVIAWKKSFGLDKRKK